AWKPRDHVSVSPIVTEVNLLALDRLHETLSFAVIVGITAATHRTYQAVVGKYAAIGFGSVLHAAVGVVNAAARWLSGLDRGSQSRQGKPRIDLPTERIANHSARPGVQNHCQVDEAGRDANVRDIADPELIGAAWAEATGKVGEDRPVVVAVRGAHELAQGSHLKAILAQQSRGKSAHSASMRSRRALFSAAGRRPAVIVSRARQLHDSAPPRDGDGFG